MKNLFLLLGLTFVLASCQVNIDSKLYADKTAGMEIYMKLDDKLVDQMKPKEKSDTVEAKFAGKDINDLPKGWFSMYDLAKDNDTLQLDADSIRILKMIEMKVDVDGEKFRGFGMRINHAVQRDLQHFENAFLKFNPAADMDKEKAKKTTKGMEIDWDGKRLIIPTDNGTEETTSNEKKEKVKKEKGSKNKKDDGMEDFDFVKAMFGDASFTMTYRYSFEKKIKKIKGKHDLVRKVDDYTVEYRIDFLELMDMSKEGKKLKKQDKFITVITE
ncbi:MAG: hypothetical protein ACK4ND_01285 [Cytophagaceae bacterium]